MNTTTIESLNAAVAELKTSLHAEQQNLVDAEHDFNEAVACEAADDELSDCQSYIEQRGFAVKRAEARLKAAESEVQAFLAKSKADTGNAHRDAAQAGAARIRELLAKIAEVSGQLVGLNDEMYELVSDVKQNVMAARQHGVAVDHFHIAAPDLSALQRAVVLVSRVGVHTTVL